MDKATPIPMGLSNLTINCGRDGTWLNFTASNGKSASLNVDHMAKGGIIGAALLGWCDDRQRQAEQIRAASAC